MSNSFYLRPPRLRSRLIPGLILLAAALALPNVASADTLRSSTSFGIQFDVISAGGGASQSAGFQQPQSVIGQSIIWSNYSSANIQTQPLGTGLIPDPSSSVAGWALY